MKQTNITQNVTTTNKSDQKHTTNNKLIQTHNEQASYFVSFLSFFVSFFPFHSSGWHDYHHLFPWDYAAAELSAWDQWNPTKAVFFRSKCVWDVAV